MTEETLEAGTAGRVSDPAGETAGSKDVDEAGVRRVFREELASGQITLAQASEQYRALVALVHRERERGQPDLSRLHVSADAGQAGVRRLAERTGLQALRPATGHSEQPRRYEQTMHAGSDLDAEPVVDDAPRRRPRGGGAFALVAHHGARTPRPSGAAAWPLRTVDHRPTAGVAAAANTSSRGVLGRVNTFEY